MIETPKQVLNQEEKEIMSILETNDRIITNEPRMVYIVLSNLLEAKSIVSKRKINIDEEIVNIIAVVKDDILIRKRF